MQTHGVAEYTSSAYPNTARPAVAGLRNTHNALFYCGFGDGSNIVTGNNATDVAAKSFSLRMELLTHCIPTCNLQKFLVE